MRGKRKDVNQAQLERALEQLGIAFADTSALGFGFPDLVVGYQGVNYLYEVKQTTKSKLTEKEQVFQARWGGHYKVITQLEDILEDLGL